MAKTMLRTPNVIGIVVVAVADTSLRAMIEILVVVRNGIEISYREPVR